MGQKLLLTVVTVFSLIPRSEAQSSLNSTVFGIGKCDEIVGNFLLELMMGTESQKTVEESKKVLDCYNSLKGDSAKKLKISYDYRYDKYEYYSHGAEYCTSFLLQDVEFIISKCPEYTGFRNNNATVKRNALNSAKGCIFKALENYCFSSPLSYMRLNYEKVVNYLTTSPENDNCESVQVDLQRGYNQLKRLRVMLDWHAFRKYVTSWYSIPDVTEYNNTCNNLKMHNTDKCNIYSTDQAMKKCEVYTAIGSEFYQCIIRFGEVYPATMGSCSTEDQLCIKHAMIKKCGESSVAEFGKYYAWFNKYDLMKPDSIKLDDKDFEKFQQPKLDNGISADSEVGNCAPIVDELVSILSRKHSFVSEKNIRIETEISSKILNCYGSISSKGSESVKELFAQVCDKLEFKNKEMFLFLNAFYRELRARGKTIDDSEYFSKNLTTKRKAFKDGKQFILNLADKFGLGEDYLNKKYNNFVDLITIRPENDANCVSVYSTTETYPCTSKIDSMVEGINTTTNWDSSVAVLILKECGYAEKCLNGTSCPTEQTDRILNWCNEAKQGNVYFLSCLDQLHQEKQTFPSDHCATKIAKNTNTGGAYMQLFKSDKECLKNTMQEECGSDAIREFDANYRNVDENIKRKN